MPPSSQKEGETMTYLKDRGFDMRLYPLLHHLRYNSASGIIKMDLINQEHLLPFPA